MNAKEAYDVVNTALRDWAKQPPIDMPPEGTDREKVEYLLAEYSKRLKKKFWRYRFFWNNKKIPDMICMYLADMLDDEGRGAS